MVHKQSTKYKAYYTGWKDRRATSRLPHLGYLEFNISCGTVRERTDIEILDLGREIGTLKDLKLYFKWVVRQLEAAEKEHFG